MNREGMLKKKQLPIFSKKDFFFNVMLYYHIWLHMQCWGASYENSSFASF